MNEAAFDAGLELALEDRHDLAVSRSLVDVLELHVPEQPDAAAPPQLCDYARLDRRLPLQHQSHQRVKLPADQS